ncbi:MAG: hypothetical protein HY909_16725 [Deltaproteobacteria bacterium]|nr:hypothetical protein [Deltaproteobacteria bacterium]
MELELVPCPGCSRHVRADAGACPFCGVPCAQGAPGVSWRRVGVGVLLAVAASATLNACYGAPPCPQSDPRCSMDYNRDAQSDGSQDR